MSTMEKNFSRLIAFVWCLWSSANCVAAPTERPRLFVIVSVDQLCYEYLDRFRDHLAADGFFMRVRRDGAWFTECHHRHAYTITGAGHSVMMTGTYPNRTGIIDNEWYDQSKEKA